MEKLRQGVAWLAYKFIWLPLIPFFAYMSYFTFRYTFVFPYSENEYVVNYFDTPLKTVLWLLGILILGCFLCIISRKIKLIYLVILCMLALGLGIYWVIVSGSVPYGDQAYLVQAAMNFCNEDFGMLIPSGYVGFYPHQMGLIFLLEVLFRIFGPGKYIVFQLLNTVFLPLFFFSGYMLSGDLFGEEAEGCFLLFATGNLGFLLYVPYVYGDLGAACLMVFLAWTITRYCKTSRPIWAALMGIATVLTIILRKNTLIFFIAVFLCLLVFTLQTKKRRYILCGAGLILIALLVQPIFRGFYGIRSGTWVGKGIPSSAFIAMGMQDGWPGPGWYNNYSKELYQIAESNTEITDIAAKAYISERIKQFQDNPKMAKEFYKYKLVTQWNEPTFGAFWVNRSFSEKTAESAIVKNVFEGKICSLLETIFNRQQTMVYVFFLAASVYLLLKKREGYLLIIPIVVLGGVLFSLLWEAKSRYILPYYISMSVFAAFGLSLVCQFIQKRGRDK